MSASSLAAHRIQALRTSSSKLSDAFSSYGASPSDLLSLDLGFPGIGVSVPDGWIKDWYANRTHAKEDALLQKEKEERRKRRAERRKRKKERREKKEKREAAIAEGKITLGRQRGRPKKIRNEERPAPRDNDGSNDGDESNGEGEDKIEGCEEEKAVGIVKRKRPRSDLEDEASGSPRKKKPRKQTKNKSAQFVVDSESD
jgi:hypothetical protein